MPLVALICIRMSLDPDSRPDIAPRRMGGAMIVASWIVVIALLGMLFGGLLEGQSNPNRDLESVRDGGGTVHVQLRGNRQGHYVASGRINDEPVTFLVDTGATDVSIPAALAHRLGLRRGAAIATRTANGTITTWRTRLDRVQLGDIVLENVRASINPGMAGGEVLLGMSFLRSLDFMQRDGSLILSQRQAG